MTVTENPNKYINICVIKTHLQHYSLCICWIIVSFIVSKLTPHFVWIMIYSAPWKYFTLHNVLSIWIDSRKVVEAVCMALCVCIIISWLLLFVYHKYTFFILLLHCDKFHNIILSLFVQFPNVMVNLFSCFLLFTMAMLESKMNFKKAVILRNNCFWCFLLFYILLVLIGNFSKIVIYYEFTKFTKPDTFPLLLWVFLVDSLEFYLSCFFVLGRVVLWLLLVVQVFSAVTATGK